MRSKDFQRISVRLADRKLDIHDAATQAYAAWRACGFASDLGSIHTEMLQLLLLRSQLVVTAPVSKRDPLCVVGGFNALTYIAELELRCVLPGTVSAIALKAKAENLHKTISDMAQSEITLALLQAKNDVTTSAIASLVDLLTNENQRAIFGRANPDQRTIAKAIGVHLSALKRPTSLVTESDSSILTMVLGEQI